MPRFLRVSTIRTAVPQVLGGALAALLLGAAGCLMEPTYTVSVTTAEGVKLDVPLDPREIDIHDDAIAVKKFEFMPSKVEGVKALGYKFKLEFKHGAKPASVTIDDVTEEPIMTIYANNDPKMGPDASLWEGQSAMFHPADEHVKWVMTLDNGVRTYRFTVKLVDGSTHVLRYPMFIPAQAKQIIRDNLGVN